MTLRFVHAADLHLDSPFAGLLKASPPENVHNALISATFDAYKNLIDLCIAEDVDALLVAGDVYDGADRSLRAQLEFIDGLKRLDDAGIRSFVCHGNHDPLDGWEANLDYPQGCKRFEAEFESEPVFPDAPNRAVVYGISYRTREVRENLTLGLERVEPGPFSIGLMHANVGGNKDHDAYAPCSLEDLARSGIDYWALGHVHTRQTLRERHPTVVYPGNTQGRHINETGARGAYLVDVGDDGSIKLDFRPLDTVRWARLDVDISGLDGEQQLLDAIDDGVDNLLDGADGRHIVVRVTLSGRGSLHHFARRPGSADDVLTNINDTWAVRTPFAWCERIETDKTAPPFDRDGRVQGADFTAEFLKTLDRAKADPDLLSRLRSGFPDLYQNNRIRHWLSKSEPTGEEMLALIEEAESIVIDLLEEADE